MGRPAPFRRPGAAGAPLAALAAAAAASSGAALPLATHWAAASGAGGSGSAPPNIVMIMSDDQNINEVPIETNITELGAAQQEAGVMIQPGWSVAPTST